MSDRHDYLALDWVRGEIQETLNQAQQALEAFVESPDDSTRMRFCQTHLHQVYGTLQMVEFYGAALLAEEMEKLAHALLDGRVGNVADALETLMRAILQLPPYLERVASSRRDLPVVLLPLLNDLRAARGESLLSETALFKPDLSHAAGSGKLADSVINDPRFAQLAKKIRQMYQIALLGVLRNDKMAESLGYMAKVFTKLEQVTGDAARGPLWSISGALVEGLSGQAITLGTSVKMVLGQVDRCLRELVSDGAEALDRPAPTDLLKNLLYYVAKAEVDSPRITRVKERFRLADALPSEDMINAERARMNGPDAQAIGSVVQALSEELNKVKDALEQFVHNDETDASKLQPQTQVLKQVADTVAVLGLGQPRALVEEQLYAMEDIVAGKRPAQREALMDIAGALLYVEATLAGISGDRRGSYSIDEQEMPSHVGQAMEAVLRECRAGLEEAKDGIVEFIASHWDREHLTPVPERLNAVRGGLDVVQLHKPALILRQCVSFIEQRLLADDQPQPDWRSMDTLADAITSVEYYLERLSDDPTTNDSVLQLAKASVESLGFPLNDDSGFDSSPASDTSADLDSATATEPDEADASASPAQPPEALTPAQSEAPPSESHDPVADQPQPASADDTSQAAPVAEAPAAAAQPVADQSSDDDDDLIDDEIIEIFQEEADEVLQALDEYFPRWAANTSDEQSLVEFRRAFHTLKGSGRMVGASTVGELAWSVENMMNRVIDRTIEPTPVLISLVQAVRDRIPALVDAFSKQQPDPYDVQPLADAADTLANGGQLDQVPQLDDGAGEGAAPLSEGSSTSADDSIELADIAAPEPDSQDSSDDHPPAIEVEPAESSRQGLSEDDLSAFDEATRTDQTPAEWEIDDQDDSDFEQIELTDTGATDDSLGSADTLTDLDDLQFEDNDTPLGETATSGHHNDPLADIPDLSQLEDDRQPADEDT
ncbi:MAG: Hpt domain-containing protein [Alcanivorax sp.]|nr:Hpt domain-containing protein [Alcanivorax sp.]